MRPAASCLDLILLCIMGVCNTELHHDFVTSEGIQQTNHYGKRHQSQLEIEPADKYLVDIEPRISTQIQEKSTETDIKSLETQRKSLETYGKSSKTDTLHSHSKSYWQHTDEEEMPSVLDELPMVTPTEFSFYDVTPTEFSFYDVTPTEFSFYDVMPSDGRVSFAELVAGSGEWEGAHIAFMESDEDEDGFLDREEFYSACLVHAV